jgi:hypothetical protein
MNWWNRFTDFIELHGRPLVLIAMALVVVYMIMEGVPESCSHYF